METHMNTPRRPLVPGPADPQPTQQSIAERAIAMREARMPAYQRGVESAQSGLVQMPGLLGRLHSDRPFVGIPVGNIAGAIANIMANVGHVKKGGYNAYHKYHYVRMEDLLEVITPLMGQNGLAVIQNEIEIKNIEGNRVAVLYEFSIFHKSGEVWPERPRHTGMAIARDSKGNWDDKAISKAHTNARKYFFLALFQVPAGDFDDVDDDVDDDANQHQKQSPVPGPKESETNQAGAEQIKTIQEDTPHKIMLGPGHGADQWASAYIRAIGKATTEAEVTAWDSANDQTLQGLSENYPGIYEQIEAAVARHLSDLNGGGMPKGDAQATINWAAAKMAAIQTQQELEAFWNTNLAPNEQDFDVLDWEMLMKEFQRNEAR